ncbi:MAG TPA: FAD-dependent oxidoreductase, partial [Candidatus Nanoarchaeia archaeon]|nr:FAD-dependent oxidoreductase [Candidatus Nanoarchaeia archaeon]
MTQRPHIVILGAGFAGIYTFFNIRKYLSPKQARITIINKTNYFLFTPLLHEVATGGLAHHQVVEAIRAITYKKGADVHVSEVKNISTKQKTIETEHGTISYDHLVIATGATTEFYGIPGAQDKTYVLKTLRDAIRIRNGIIDAFERAVETADPAERRKTLTFVLVGGGPTGVELSAEVAEYFQDAFKRFLCGKISPDEVTIHLIAGEPDLLNNFAVHMKKRAREILERAGVTVQTNSRVVAVDDSGVALADGSRINSSFVIWVAGVRPNVPPLDITATTKESRGRL